MTAKTNARIVELILEFAKRNSMHPQVALTEPASREDGCRVVYLTMTAGVGDTFCFDACSIFDATGEIVDDSVAQAERHRSIAELEKLIGLYENHEGTVREMEAGR